MITPGPRRLFRVAMVGAGEFPSPRGSQALMGGVARVLATRGHEVHLVTYASRGAGLEPDGVRMHRPIGGGHGLPPGPGWGRLAEDFRLLVTLYRVVREQEVDLIHAHNYEAAIAACLVRGLTRAPVVYHAHNVLGDELPFYARTPTRRRWAGMAGRWLDQVVPRRADYTIAMKPEVAEYLRSCQVAADRLGVIAPVIQDLPCRAEAVLPPGCTGRFVVTYAGNLDPYQDLHVLADGFGRFADTSPGALLLIATHERGWRDRVPLRLLELVERGLALVAVTEDLTLLSGWLGGSDVLVCPRPSWSGFPMKLFNYVAAGRPILAAESSAAGLEGAMLRFPDGDGNAFAAILERLRREPDLRREMAGAAEAAGRRLADPALNARAIEEVYEAIFRTGGATRE